MGQVVEGATEEVEDGTEAEPATEAKEEEEV